MPTPDRTAGPSLEEELQLENRDGSDPADTDPGDPSIVGAIRQVGGVFKGLDDRGVTPLGLHRLVTDSVTGNVVVDSVTGDVVWI